MADTISLLECSFYRLWMQWAVSGLLRLATKQLEGVFGEQQHLLELKARLRTCSTISIETASCMRRESSQELVSIKNLLISFVKMARS